MQPGVLAALASATIVAPDEARAPAALESAVRQACAGAWRAVEVVLAGDVLRGRLGKTRDTYVRDGVDAVLGLFGSVAVRPEPLAELRAARKAGALDGALDIAAIAARVRVEGAAAVGKTAVASVRHGLADYPALEAVLAEHEVAALLVDAARALFRNLARDPELARWAIGPTGVPGRDRALVAFAELVGSPASIDELDALIALPIHLDDNVQFTVYRPRAIDPGRWHPLLAFAHLADRRPGDDTSPDPVEEVRRQAESVLGEHARGYQQVTQDAGAAIPAEGELVFVPEIAGIEFNPPRRSFLWLEAVHREEFRMRAGAALDGKTCRGRLTVFLGHIAIAEVPLAVRVDRQRPEPAREPAQARTYRRIFASYSHKDVAIVNQFESYARALGDEYLRDWIHLRTGEVWNDRLRQLIEQADAFQLFWSSNSMHSKFVRQEYEHALALNRPSFVRPTYWEDPMPTAPGLPPDALLRLHFQKLGGAIVTPGEAPAEAHPRTARPGGTMPAPAAPLSAPRPAPPPAIPVLAIPNPRRDTARQTPIVAEESLDSASTAPAMVKLDHEYDPTAPRIELDPTDPLRKQELPTKRARSAPRPNSARENNDYDDDPVIEPPPPPPGMEHLRPRFDSATDEVEHERAAEPAYRPPRPTESSPLSLPAYAPASQSDTKVSRVAAPRPSEGLAMPVPPMAMRPAASNSTPPPHQAAAEIRPPRPTEAAPMPPAPSRAPAPGPRANEPPEPAPEPLAEAAPPKIPATLPNKAPPMPQPGQSPVPARPSQPMAQPPVMVGRVICDRCGTENAIGTKFCSKCGTVLPQQPPLAALARKKAASDPPVSPYAQTVEQRRYEGPDAPTVPQKSRASTDADRIAPPASTSTRWVIVSVLLVLVVAAVVIYLILR